MPFQLHWTPSPKNMKLKVHEELPDFFIKRNYFLSNLEYAECTPSNEEIMMLINQQKSDIECNLPYDDLREQPYFVLSAYKCHWCRGWIIGKPNEYEEHTMSPFHPLSGRSGIAFYCVRCGREISFAGKVS